jgi:hypothetical protein
MHVWVHARISFSDPRFEPLRNSVLDSLMEEYVPDVFYVVN